MTSTLPEVSPRQIEAYEHALRALLGIRTLDEVRETFSKVVVQEAAVHLEEAVAATRDRGQALEYSLAWAVDGVIRSRMQEQGVDLEQQFYDADYHVPPSEATADRVKQVWDEVG